VLPALVMLRGLAVVAGGLVMLRRHLVIGRLPSSTWSVSSLLLRCRLP
jgi:hypothetical protein